MTVHRVSPAQADALVREQGYAYLDVRSIPEFDAGHPEGAYNIPILHQTAAGMVPNPAFIAEVQSNFDKDAKLVLGCRSGNRSLRAAEMLQAAGFTQVVEQRAGWSGARDAFGQLQEPGWESAGLATSTSAQPGRDYESLSAKG